MSIRLLHGDCRMFESELVGDVMITDPPYSAHVHKNATSQSKGRGTRKRDLGFEHLSQDLMWYTCDLAAAVKRWSVIFTDVESVGDWIRCLDNAGAKYIRCVPWVRWSMPQLSGDRPPQGHEMIVLAYGKSTGRKHWNGPGNLTHFAHTCLRGDGKHKAEKPLDLMLDLVNWFSDEGETVIDPFAGSGTTGLAAKMLGRNFIGSELDSTWHAKATNRLVAPLSKRDADRYDRWIHAQTQIQADKERMKKHTAKVRAA